jgi:apolipoprotein D and lipocalin family protein
MKVAVILFWSTLMTVIGLYAVRPVDSGYRITGALTTVEQVDLKRYTGTWYEIAKVPNRFQRKCACCTTAYYSLCEDGRIDVLNRCIKKDGTRIDAKGIARVVETKSNAKLKVSFVRFLGISLFWGDYWIIGLGEDYEYAIVGTPTRKYGWILSRRPWLSQEALELAFSQLRAKGYDPARFEMTLHTKSSQ